MASLGANPRAQFLSTGASPNPLHIPKSPPPLNPTKPAKLWPNSRNFSKFVRFGSWVSPSFSGNQRWSGVLGRCGEEVGGRDHDGYLVREFGWGVRRLDETREEMWGVAAVQAEAFHAPVAFFNDLFYEFFKAEVLSALIYKLRNSPPDRYACLVAESVSKSDSLQETAQGFHLEGAEEYIYVSGIAVLQKFRRKKIATVLLKACDAVSLVWGYDYLALRAYEDDSAARSLYANAGYKVVSKDPFWVTFFGKKRRVLMIKQSAFDDRIQPGSFSCFF
uniref:N-acetyltransferase domain-containing protein n=1 Tax=Ananas comosus var. bracteatus TaxID=296719 RepID=A0A6V7NI44_ANACO|nr:unnamed protein product [Ananas comosus var. bracteatus]